MGLANVERARSILSREGVELVLATTRENSLYLSGIDNHGQLAFPYTERSYVAAPAEAIDCGVLVVSAGRLEVAGAADDSISDIVGFGEFVRRTADGVPLHAEERAVRDAECLPDAFTALAEALRRLGGERATVGVDARGPEPDLLARLTTRFPHARFVPAAGLLREIRAVKTPEEIERMRIAFEINEAGFRAVFEAASRGIRESDLRHTFAEAVTARGGEPGHCLLKFGRRMAMFQDPRGDAELADGDSIFLDAGASHRGYRSDLGRLVSFGEPSERLRTLYSAGTAGQSQAVERLVPGHVVADAFHAAVSTARAEGSPGFARHHTGHAVGLEWNDHPMVSAEATVPVEPGMIINVELPYYELGFGGAHIEDTFQTGPDRPVRLSTLPQELLVLPVD
jgi:Xaa-Pro dipeptidase